MKHWVKLSILVFLTVLIMSLIFTACTNSTNASSGSDDVSTETDTPELPEVKFTVKYETEHGILPDSIRKGITVKENTILKSENLPVLSEDGFAFGGWYDGDELVVADKYKVTKDVTLTARWTVAIVSYTISFESEHGTKPDALVLPENTILTEDNLPVLSEEGYRFDGWFDGYSKIEAGIYKLQKDIVLTAKWTAGYVIHFDANGGVGTMPDQFIVPEGKSIKLYKNEFTREGYVFDCWGYTANNPVTFTFDECFTAYLSKVFSPVYITYYAQWRKLCLVTYESLYGNVPESFYVPEDTVRDDSSFSSEQLPVLYDENHNFEGWYIGDKKIFENYNITSDIILTAKWTPKCKSVQYYVDNKQIERKELFYYSETPEKEVLDYSSANKAFLGWKKDVNTAQWLIFLLDQRFHMMISLRVMVN